MDPKENDDPKKPAESTIAPLRTYESDIQEAIRRNKESAATIMIAEQKKRQGGNTDTLEPPEKKPFPLKVVLLTSVSALLILGGITMLSLFLFKGQSPQVKEKFQAEHLITTEFEKEIVVEGMSRSKLVSILNREKNGSFIEITSMLGFLLSKGAEKDKKLITAEELFKILELAPPSSFIRALEPQFQLGLHGSSGNQPFLILKTTSYQIAFSGMLRFEDRIEEDLGPIFLSFDIRALPSLGSTTSKAFPGNTNTAVTKAATSTKVATSTVKSSAELKDLRFTDAVLKNKDARVLRDSNGKIVFLYSFVDPDTIVITTNENTFQEIISRLHSAKLIR